MIQAVLLSAILIGGYAAVLYAAWRWNSRKSEESFRAALTRIDQIAMSAIAASPVSVGVQEEPAYPEDTLRALRSLQGTLSELSESFTHLLKRVEDERIAVPAVREE
jgi:hypothetical protein